MVVGEPTPLPPLPPLPPPLPPLPDPAVEVVVHGSLSVVEVASAVEEDEESYHELVVDVSSAVEEDEESYQVLVVDVSSSVEEEEDQEGVAVVVVVGQLSVLDGVQVDAVEVGSPPPLPPPLPPFPLPPLPPLPPFPDPPPPQVQVQEGSPPSMTTLAPPPTALTAAALTGVAEREMRKGRATAKTGRMESFILIDE